MKMFSKILIFTAVCCSPLIVFQSLGTDQIDLTFEPRIVVIDPTEKAKIGSSMNCPVVFEKIKKYPAYKFERDNYIRKHYEGYRITVDSLMINSKGRILQSFVLRNDDGETALVYFDADDAFRKYKKIEDKELGTRVEKLIKAEKKD